MPTPSATSSKKTKSSGQNHSVPHCVVEGCTFDLSKSKVYHRKHRVCDDHSKSPKVVVGGLERQFCQQCSRFHSLMKRNGVVEKGFLIIMHDSVSHSRRPSSLILRGSHRRFMEKRSN